MQVTLFFLPLPVSAHQVTPPIPYPFPVPQSIFPPASVRVDSGLKL